MGLSNLFGASILLGMETLENHPAVQHYGSIRATAAALGLSSYALQQRVRAGKPPITAEDAVKLETASHGALTRSQLRPDLWPE